MIDVIKDRIVRKNPFLREWSNYGIIDIFNPVATAQHQHAVTITSKPGMSHDFRDLRFFQEDGTEIPFWNESKTDGSTSFNWFKPYSASNRKVYVFYGNREAVSQSNGDMVFEFFDDFTAGAIDTSKWTIVSGTPTFSNGTYCNLTGGAELNTVRTFGTGYILRAHARLGDVGGSGNYQTISYGWQPYFDFGKAANSEYWIGNYNGTNYNGSNIGTAGSYPNYYYWDFERNGTSTKFYCNLESSLATRTLLSTNTMYVDAVARVIALAGIGSGYLYTDTISLRKYTATEPACQFNTFGLRV